MAAILAADVVEYSRHMRSAEERTLARLSEMLKVADGVAARHSGRLFGIAGDSFMAEFASPVEAVRCAIELHEKLSEAQLPLSPADRIELRIGVNLDDVIREAGNVYGNGVNLAARLQALAGPGVTVVSKAVYEHVRHHVPATFESLGERRVKNLPEPVHAYRVNAAGPTKAPGFLSRHRVLAGTTFAAAAAAIAGIAYLSWPAPPQITRLATLEAIAPVPPDETSIVVLPFTDLSPNPDDFYLTQGISSDIITDLSKINGLLIIAQNSSTKYEGKDIAPLAVAEDLGVGFVLVGTLRRVGERLRINSQLIETHRGEHVWANRWDVELAGFFDVQDQIVANIVRSLAVTVSPKERDRVYRRETSSMPAYEAFRRGTAHLLRHSPDGLADALVQLKRAVAIDPDYSSAYALMGQVYWNAWVWGWEASVGETWETAPNMAKSMLDRALRAPTATAYQLACDINLYARMFDEAEKFARLAVEYDPNDPISHVKLAESAIYSGRPGDGQASIRTAMRLDPFYRPYDIFVEGLALFGQERFEQAIPSLRKALSQNPDDFAPAAPLAAALAHLGRWDEARAALEAYRTGWPEANVEELKIYWPFRHGVDEDRLVGPLRQLGLPEQLAE